MSEDKAATPNSEKMVKALCVSAEGYDVAINKYKIKRSVKTLNRGEIMHVKGTGMSGFYKPTEETKKNMNKTSKSTASKK